MANPKLCLNPEHKTEPTFTVDGSDVEYCKVCSGERLSFKPGEDPGIDDLMDRATTTWPGPGRIVEVPDTVCWMAYYTDWSGIAVFDNEIDCLRHAVANHMEVIELSAGDVRDQINTQHRKASDV